MFCEKCGKEIRDDIRFCNFCGAPTRNAGVKKNENEPRPAKDPEPAAQTGGGLSTLAKVLLPIAIVAIVGAGIFAAVTLRSPKDAGKDETAAVSEASVESSVEAESAGKEDSAAKPEAKEESSAPAASAEASAAASSEETAEESGGSGGETTKPVLADDLITALKRPSFFDGVSMTYTSVTPAVPTYMTASGSKGGFNAVTNANYFYLNTELTAQLEKEGFAISATNGREFFSQYESNRYNLLPNFVTVDSIMHVYHLYFSHLLKTTEKNYLSDTIAELSKKMLDKSKEQLEIARGTEWETAALRNVGFFAVGYSLIDNVAFEIPEEIREAVNSDRDKIMDASHIEFSAVLGTQEDFSQYKPRGYYEGNEQLERYFRTMMWYGRMNFAINEEDLTKSAVLMTVAMNDSDIFSMWESVYSVTSFFAGASDDCGYYEYMPVIDEAFFGGNAAAGLDGLLNNKEGWETFMAYAEQMPAPQINSVPGMDDGGATDKRETNKGFRFMGQRFSLDAAIFQNLIYSTVKENSNGDKRLLPDALDIPAAMGSDEALAILEEKGATNYPNYMEKMESLRQGMEIAPDTLWSASLYSRWLYTLRPLLEEKGEGWPSFMQSENWTRKDLQTFLGSYAELKHDTVLYAKQVMAEMGGDAIEQKDDRGYVEPEAEVYARLSVLTEATINGLDGYGILDSEDKENLSRIKALCDQLCEISQKELQNEALSNDDYELIRTYGGQLEHFWEEAYRDESSSPNIFEFPAAIITDIATNPNGSVLEIGTGGVSTIYVVFPIDGELHIASGSVYSFYQFEQPLSDRLTDTQWRQMMGIQQSSGGGYNKPEKQMESWTDDFTWNPNQQ